MDKKKLEIDKYFKQAVAYNKKRYGDQGYFLWEDTVVALMFQLERLTLIKESEKQTTTSTNLEEQK